MDRRSFFPAVAAGVLLAAGCGGPPMAAVTGEVRSNGKPVANAAVTFSPASAAEGALNGPGKPSTGYTDADGKFVLSAYRAYDGALIGPHRVTVSLDDGNPAKCPRLKKTTFEVKPGDNHPVIEMND